MKLSKNFTLEELINTQHKDLLESQTEDVKPYMENLHILANYILQPIRDYYKIPVTITSGFRGKSLNERVGGSKNSQHCFGQAADFIINGKTNDEIFDDIKSGKINITYRQLIKESVGGKFWIHIAMLRYPYDSNDVYKQNLIIS